MFAAIFFRNAPSCRWVRRQLSSYVDGMLSEDERMQVFRHVGTCSPCSLELDELCKTVTLLGEVKEECLPSQLHSYRLPRWTFVQLFPTIQKARPPLTLRECIPYFSAAILLVLVLSTWDLVERHMFHEYYNDSNYVKVVAKI